MQMSSFGTAALGEDRTPTVIENITFDADFECGNIDQVRKKGSEYDIWIRNDTNATNNLQWFMFRMKNSPDYTGTIKLNIVNFTKGNSLFIHVSTSLIKL